MGGGSGREVEVGGGRWEREEGKGRAVGRWWAGVGDMERIGY